MTPLSPANWLHRLTEPVAAVQHPEQRRQSRLLASLLLALMVLALLVVLVNHVYFGPTPILEDSLLLLGVGFVLFLFIPYQLSRHGRYPLAAVLTIVAFMLGTGAAASSGEVEDIYFLDNALLVILIASVFLSIRSTLIVAAVSLLSILAFAVYVQPVFFPYIIFGPFSTVLLGSILIWLFTHHRQRLEADRQARLAESEERNRVLVELCRDGVFIETVEGRVLECNSAACDMFQYSREEMLGKYVRDLVSDDFARTLPDVIITEEPEPVERLDKKSDGTLFPVEVYTRFYTFGDEKRLIVFVHDITKRKQAEAALAEERNLLRALIDHLPDHIYVKDRQSRFIMLNAPTARYLGAATPEAVIGKRDFDFFPEAVAAQLHAEEQQILATGDEQINVEQPQFDDQGREMAILVTKVPLRDNEGNIVGLVGINRDVTERKQAEAQRLKLALERERLTLVGRFVQAVSHDFRTALANIETSRYLTQKNLSDDERAKVQPRLDNIRRAVFHLTEQIGNLHTISSLADPEIEPCDLNAMVETLVAEQAASAQQKNVQFTFIPTADLPLLVADMEELKRAVRHLLVNALSHTPEGGSIMVTTAQAGAQVFLTISDTGMGIERQHLPHIFDPFYRGDTARSIDSGGVGLGLSIVKMVAEAHGGMISVESTPGQGSVFILSLPVTQDQLTPG